MNKSLLIFLTFTLMLLCSCSTQNTSDDTTLLPSSPETTTLNILPDNEYDESRKTISVPVFSPDYNKPAETNLNDDGSSYTVYDCYNKDYHDICYFNDDGSVMEYRKETYNSNGTLDCIYVFDSNMNFLYCCSREYDSLNRYYRYYYYNSECQLACYEVLDYDGYGNQTGPFIYNPEGKMLEEYPELY